MSDFWKEPRLTGEYLPVVDRVEVLILEDMEDVFASEHAPLPLPEMGEYFVKTSATVEGEAAHEIAQLLDRLPMGNPDLCHNPGYGLRWYVNNRLIREATICAACNNICIHEKGRSFWRSFDAEHTISRRFLQRLTESVQENGHR